MILIFLKNLQNQKNQSEKEKKALTLKNVIILLNGKQKVFNDFESGIFPKGKQWKGLTCILNHVATVFDHKQFKILSLKQILQRFTITFAQVKAGNTSENLLNEIRQIIYSLYQAK